MLFISNRVSAKSIFTITIQKRTFSLCLFRPLEQIILETIITKVAHGYVLLTSKNQIKGVLASIIECSMSGGSKADSKSFVFYIFDSLYNNSCKLTDRLLSVLASWLNLQLSYYLHDLNESLPQLRDCQSFLLADC